MATKLSAPLLYAFALMMCGSAFAQNYDIVIEGGRVMDPETGLDAVRNVGITHGKVARISNERLTGERVLSARGWVVAPGFVDLHQHAQDIDSGRLKAFDGVTTALEMEIGVPDVAKFLQGKRGHSWQTASRERHFKVAASRPGQPPHPTTVRHTMCVASRARGQTASFNGIPGSASLSRLGRARAAISLRAAI